MKTGDGVIALLMANGICCGLMVFGLTGSFSGLIGWLSDLPTAGIVGALLLTIAVVMLLRRRKARRQTDLSDPGQGVEVEGQGVGGEKQRDVTKAF